ncbi:tigger transposable element-derived protein 1-like [Leptopilina heterotoma]|uniref:tigger transposable element-derived protein 1-like n=1 Tax=Leptopilina heterotoma TaxID=63436 RepID=UPI001CA8F1B3|nr:tigger transposable element-derived protein 1-like [Leptopilina heterotoma]
MSILLPSTDRISYLLSIENRHVLLTLDNCSSHSLGELTLSNVNVQFFPANTTSRLQPLDQGIIALMKKYYRTRLVRTLIQAIEEGAKAPTWNVLNAIEAIKLSWDSVSAEAIANCFKKAWKRSNITNNEEVVSNDPEEWQHLLSINGVRKS